MVFVYELNDKDVDCN